MAIGSTPVYTYTIVNSYPHSPASFTEGLVYTDGAIFESTGDYGPSVSRAIKIDLATGQTLLTHTLPLTYFGEGLTALADQLYQLTLPSQTGLIYRLADLRPVGAFGYASASGQGWGLTQNGRQLIMSDGSSQLYTLDPVTFQPLGSVTVTEGATPVENLNELEYIDGQIYANVWKSNYIVRIDPQTGAALGWINLCGLRRLAQAGRPPDANAVLNGIAYDPARRRLFVTGKLWRKLFEIQLVCERNC